MKRKRAKVRPLTYGDLTPEPGDTTGRILRCDICGAEFTANAGDYWHMPRGGYVVCFCTAECNGNPVRRGTIERIFKPEKRR